jgi:hypothetical protein
MKFYKILWLFVIVFYFLFLFFLHIETFGLSILGFSCGFILSLIIMELEK